MSAHQHPLPHKQLIYVSPCLSWRHISINPIVPHAPCEQVIPLHLKLAACFDILHCAAMLFLQHPSQPCPTFPIPCSFCSIEVPLCRFQANDFQPFRVRRRRFSCLLKARTRRVAVSESLPAKTAQITVDPSEGEFSRGLQAGKRPARCNRAVGAIRLKQFSWSRVSAISNFLPLFSPSPNRVSANTPTSKFSWSRVSANSNSQR